MKKEVPSSPGYQQYKGEFIRLGRQIRAMERQKLKPPQEMLERMVGLNHFLKSEYPDIWVDNFSNVKRKRK